MKHRSTHNDPRLEGLRKWRAGLVRSAKADGIVPVTLIFTAAILLGAGSALLLTALAEAVR